MRIAVKLKAEKFRNQRINVVLAPTWLLTTFALEIGPTRSPKFQHYLVTKLMVCIYDTFPDRAALTVKGREGLELN